MIRHGAVLWSPARSDGAPTPTAARPDLHHCRCLCLSQTEAWNRIVRRDRNNSKWQQFTGVNTQNTAGTQRANVAFGQVVQGNGVGTAFTAVMNVTNIAGSYFGGDGFGVVPASLDAGTQSAARARQKPRAGRRRRESRSVNRRGVPGWRRAYAPLAPDTSEPGSRQA